jgi:hypothetical protein
MSTSSAHPSTADIFVPGLEVSEVPISELSKRGKRALDQVITPRRLDRASYAGSPHQAISGSINDGGPNRP